MSELSRKNEQELRKSLFDMRRQWRQFRFDAAGSRVRNTREGRHLRREIARVMTEMRKRFETAKTPALPETDTKK